MAPREAFDHDTLRDLHERLVATEELPVESGASVRLGEAEAVAGDALAAAGEGDPEVVRRRLEQVDRLLAGIDGTGNPDADAHVAAARGHLETLLRD